MKQLKISKQLTNRDTASLDKYLSEISRVELISADEEILLAQKIRKGDRAALDRLAKANLRFVVSVAKQYQNQGMQLPDLISEGNLGLIKAAKRFDEKRGFKFISYAVWWIRQAIMSSLNENARTIRLPSNIIQEHQKAKRMVVSEDDPDFVEKYNKQASQYVPKTVSLSNPINEEGDQLIDIVVNKDSLNPESYLENEQERKKQVKNALSILNDKERTIIEKYFGLNGVQCNLEDLGEEFGCTKERIRQVKEKAMKKLRNESFTLLKYL